jgi:hypothetical protein
LTSRNCESDSRVWVSGRSGNSKRIGARGDIDGLKDTLGFGTIDDLELRGVVAHDWTEKLRHFVNAYTDEGHYVSKIGNAVETTT